MERMISYGKMSKKEKKAYNQKRRVVWAFSPVTRKKESGKAYSRKKARIWEADLSFAALLLCAFQGTLPRTAAAKTWESFNHRLNDKPENPWYPMRVGRENGNANPAAKRKAPPKRFPAKLVNRIARRNTQKSQKQGRVSH